MKKFNCPSCGAEVTFQSNFTVYSVCGHCGSMIVRHDMDVESIGTMAALPEDMSPLQIGTEGVYQGIGFQIIGRMKLAWKLGSWNEWFVVFDNGDKSWLAEAQGSYAISYEINRPLHEITQTTIAQLVSSNNRQKVKISLAGYQDDPSGEPGLGDYLILDNQKLKIVDIKQTFCAGSEGELPVIAPNGRRTTVIDLLGAAGGFGSIEVEGTKIRAYQGHYLEWNDLRFQNTRPLEGW
jgi:hypothetical protein